MWLIIYFRGVNYLDALITGFLWYSRKNVAPLGSVHRLVALKLGNVYIFKLVLHVVLFLMVT